MHETYAWHVLASMRPRHLQTLFMDDVAEIDASRGA
jgi:hypothetical protein